MHDGSIVFTGKDVPRAPHVGGKLIHFVNLIHNFPCELQIAKISDSKVVRCAGRELIAFQVRNSHTISISFEPFHKVITNEAATAAYKHLAHGILPSNRNRTDEIIQGQFAKKCPAQPLEQMLRPSP